MCIHVGDTKKHVIPCLWYYIHDTHCYMYMCVSSISIYGTVYTATCTCAYQVSPVYGTVHIISYTATCGCGNGAPNSLDKAGSWLIPQIIIIKAILDKQSSCLWTQHSKSNHTLLCSDNCEVFWIIKLSTLEGHLIVGQSYYMEVSLHTPTAGSIYRQLDLT